MKTHLCIVAAWMLSACSQGERLHVEMPGGWGQAPAPPGTMEAWLKKAFGLGCHREKLEQRDGEQIKLTCAHADGSPTFHIFPDGALVCDIDPGREPSCPSTWSSVTSP